MRKVLIIIIMLFVSLNNMFALNQKESELFLAIKEKKNERDLKDILKYKIDFSATNENGLTAIFYAIDCDNDRALRVLLEYVDNIENKLPDNFDSYPNINMYEGDSVNIGGATPLMYAIFKSNTKIVKQLIDKGANVKAKDNEGSSVFLYACAFGNGNIIRMLLAKDKMLVNDKNLDGNVNGLHYATSFNNLDTISFLVKSVDININERDSNGCTALYYAAYYAKKEAYNLLIKLGANKDIGDNYGVTPEYILSGGSSAIDLGDNQENNNSFTNTYNENMLIVRAIQTSDTNALRNIMMYSNFNMNSVIIAYETPLTYAIHINKDDMVNELLGYRRDNTNIINIETSYIPADEVYFNEDRVEFTGNVYLGDASPLQYAIFKGNTNIINTLLKYGADINRKDGLGNNALMYGASYGTEEIIDTILNYSANSYRVVDIYGNTPLHNASSLGNTNTLIALMDRTPININIQNIDGDTPLHLAVKNNNSNTYRFLLLKGADYTIKNYDGKTASDLLYGESIENIMGSSNFLNTNNNMFNKNYDTNAKYNNNNNAQIIQANNMVEDFLYDNMPDDDAMIYQKDESDYSDITDMADKILFNAIYKEDIALIHTVISNNVDINIKNVEGFTPLLYAINYDKVEAVKALLSYTDKIDIEKTLDGYTNYYSKKGVNFNGELVFNGTTPLQYAIFKGNYDIVSLLLDNNANVRTKDLNGYNSIFYASAFADYSIINKLIKKDSSLYNIKNDNGDNVLHIAASFGNNNAISFFLYNTFLSINSKNNDGKTPLDFAKEKGYESTIEYLIKNGAKSGIN